MTLSAAVNTLNNVETMLKTVSNEEVSSTDFSAVLENKTNTLGDIKNSTINSSNKLSDFKEFLSQVTSEVNMETSLNLTLAKDITETIENFESFDKADETTDKKNSEQLGEALDTDNIIMFAQALETANHEITLDFDIDADTNIETQSEIADIATKTKTEENTAEIKPNENESQELNLDEDMLRELNIEKISSETESSNDNSSLLNKQSAEEQGIKIALNQEVKTFEIQPKQESAKPVEITPNKIIEQVSKHLESLQHTSKVDIVLNPESLGKVTIQLVKSPEGLSAQFTTATQEARNILMKGLDGLKETLTSHGVGIDNVAVKVSDTQKSEYNADWTEQEGSRGGNKEQNPKNRQEKEKGLFEKTIAQQKENGKV